MQFDMDAIDTRTASECGSEMTIKLLDGKPMKNKLGQPVTLTMLGPDSDAFRLSIRRAASKRIAKGTSASDVEDSLKEQDADSIETIVDCTIGWSGVLDKEGKQIPFSKDFARDLYQQYPVIREQADLFMSDRKNFLMGSSAN